MYVIFNGNHEVVETANSHVEALNIVSYLSSHEAKSGPFHCTPADGTVAA